MVWWNDIITKLGYTSLFPWQEEALTTYTKADCTLRKHFLYRCPTGGGKTLVGDLIAFKRLQEGARVLYLLPYTTLVKQKAKDLKEASVKFGKKVVELYFGSPDAGETKYDVAVCTIEQGVKLIQTHLAREAGDQETRTRWDIVVIDEFHTFFIGQRGQLIENMLVKIRYKSAIHNIQIIGMSATFPNYSEIISWLDAVPYTCTTRTVPLNEHVIFRGDLYIKRESDQHIRVDKVQDITSTSLEANIKLECLEMIQHSIVTQRLSCLCFCHSKKRCEKAALALAKMTSQHASGRPPLLTRFKEALSNSEHAARLEFWETVIVHGIAVHHGGLTAQERDLVEEAFSCGTVLVLFCTSTLAAGVNFPASRVFFDSMKIGISPLSVLDYRQMSGRAGRKGLADFGESYLFASSMEQFTYVRQLMSSEIACDTKEERTIESFTALLLEIIVMAKQSTLEHLMSFYATLFTTLPSYFTDCKSSSAVHLSLRLLKKMKFITESSASTYVATEFGIAASDSSVIDAYLLCREIEDSRWTFGSKLLPLYVCTPFETLTSYSCYGKFLCQLYHVVQHRRESLRNFLQVTKVPIRSDHRACNAFEWLIGRLPTREIASLAAFGIDLESLVSSAKLSTMNPRILVSLIESSDSIPRPEDTSGFIQITFERVYISMVCYAHVYSLVPQAELESRTGFSVNEIDSMYKSILCNSAHVLRLCQELRWTTISQSLEKVVLGYCNVLRYSDRILESYPYIDNLTISCLAMNNLTTMDVLMNTRLSEFRQALAAPYNLKYRSIDPAIVYSAELYIVAQLQKKLWYQFRENHKDEPLDIVQSKFSKVFKMRIDSLKRNSHGKISVSTTAETI